MMNQTVDIARNLTFWEYEALKLEWNRLHTPDSDLPQVDPEAFAKAANKLRSNPGFTGKAN